MPLRSQIYVAAPLVSLFVRYMVTDNKTFKTVHALSKYINKVKIGFLQTEPNRAPNLLTPVPLEFMRSSERSRCATHQIILKEI